MSNRLAFQTQLASIMEVLANAAVAEICKLVDDDYAVINLQMSQCQRENKALKRKLHLMELRMARGYAERRIRDSSGNRSSRIHVSPNLSDKYRAPVSDIFPNQDELYGRQLNTNVWRDGQPSSADVPVVLPAIKPDENGHEDSRLAEPNAVLVKAETSDESHAQQQLFIREDGVAEPVCEGVEANYGPVQGDKVDGQNSRTRNKALEVSGSDKVLKSEPQCESSEGLSQDPLGQLELGVSGECAPLGELFIQGGDGVDPLQSSCSYMMSQSQTKSQPDHLAQKPEIIEVESAEEGDDVTVWDSNKKSIMPQTVQRYPASSVENNNNFSMPSSSLSRLTSDFPVMASTSSVIPDVNSWQHAKGISLYKPRTGQAKHEKLFSCKYCGKAFNRPKKVEIHQRIHTGEKPFRCNTCGKLFAEAGNLKKHQKVHTGERPYSCIQCGKAFAWIRNLKTHQQKYHPDMLTAEELLSLGPINI